MFPSSQISFVTLLVTAMIGSASPAQAGLQDCTASYGQKTGNASFVDSGNSIRSDGLGMYIHGEQNSQVIKAAALNVFPFRSSVPGAVPLRHMIVDLDNPVPGGGGVPRGVISSWAGPHVFYYLDSNNHVHNVDEIKKGGTASSDLTAIFVYSGTTRYLLQMGPWAWSTCEDMGPVDTAGSTRAVITRSKNGKNWSATAPAGSIAVLNDISDPANPVSLGLYYVKFKIDFTF